MPGVECILISLNTLNTKTTKTEVVDLISILILKYDFHLWIVCVCIMYKKNSIISEFRV